jgi:hypothetical protein
MSRKPADAGLRQVKAAATTPGKTVAATIESPPMPASVSPSPAPLDADFRHLLQQRLLRMAAVLNEGVMRMRHGRTAELAGASPGPLQRQLHAVLDALDRLDQGDYGHCEGCSGPISVSRLLQSPWLRHCEHCRHG